MKQLALLLCSYLCVYADAAPTNLRYVIQALNAKINAATTLFYTNAQASLEFEAVLQQQLPPKILASEKAATQLEDLYNTNVLTVVFLAPTFTELLQQLYALLPTNRRLSHNLVLLVAYGYEEQRWLFEWCWQQRLLHVLLLSVENATTFTTYTPFPHLQLVNTTLSVYFEEYYAQTNFKGYPLHFNGGISPPRSLLHEDHHGKVLLNGFLPRLIQLFAAVHNATLRRVRTLEKYNFGRCKEMIAQQRIELCTEFYFVGGKLYLTKPIYLYDIHLLVPCAHQLPMFHYFAAPFSLQLWLLVGFTLISLTAILSLMCWCRYSRWCIDRLFFNLVACLLFLPFCLRPFSGYTQRLLYVTLVVFGYLLSTYYLALLSSIFSVHIDEQEINDIADLKRHNISILINELDVALLHSYNASVEIFERIQSVPVDVLVRKQLALDTRYGYMCADDKCCLLISQQNYMRHCRMRLLSQPTMSAWAGIVIGNNTFFEDVLNIYLQRTFETGIYEHLQLQSQEDARRMNITQYFHNEHVETVHALNLEFFQIPGMVLIIGYAFALMAFLGELVRYHYWK